MSTSGRNIANPDLLSPDVKWAACSFSSSPSAYSWSEGEVAQYRGSRHHRLYPQEVGSRCGRNGTSRAAARAAISKA